MSIIKIRRGLNGYKYSACNAEGYFIGNFEKISDIRKHWIYEIKHGDIILVRELDKFPK